MHSKKRSFLITPALSLLVAAFTTLSIPMAFAAVAAGQATDPKGAAYDISIEAKTATLGQGGTTKLTAIVKPAGSASQDVIWFSDNEKIATVDKTGLVTGKSPGKARVTAAVNGNTEIAATQEIVVAALVDNMENNSLIYDKSDGLAFDKGLGDGALKKQNNKPQSVIYKVPEISGFEVEVIFTPEHSGSDTLNIFLSPDGKSWTPAEYTKGKSVPTGQWTWNRNILSSRGPIAKGMNYIKVEIPPLKNGSGVINPDSEGWRLFLSRIGIYANTEKPRIVVKEGSPAVISGGHIYGIAPKTSREQLLEMFTAVRGELAATGKSVGTGMALGLVGEPISYPVVMIGDLDGDGAITLADVTMLRNHLTKAAPLQNAQLLAADIDGNGVVDGRDLKAMANPAGIVQAPPFPDPKLVNGVATLGFKKTEAGYGLSLLENGRLLAFEELPIQLFYDYQTSHITGRAFDTVSIEGNAASLAAKFTDNRKNTWKVTLKIEASGTNGFSGRYEYELVSGTASNVFFTAPLSVRTSQEETYFLMPGIMYDGNNRDFQTAAVRTDESQVNYPKIDAVHQYKIETPATSLATPAIGLYDKQTGRSLFYSTKDIGLCGAEGFIYRKYGPNDCLQAVITTPCYREVKFASGLPPQAPSAPIGANMSAGDKRSLNIRLSAGQNKTLAEFIRSFRDVRSSVKNMSERIQNIPFSAASKLIEDYFNQRKWLEDTYYCNVVLCGQDLKGQPSPSAGWNLMTGWCDGTMTAYSLLYTGNSTTRARAIKMMDFMCETGISKSGLFKSCYDGPTVGWNGSPWGERARMFTDAAYYLAKAIISEKATGQEHPKWEAALKSNLDALSKLWAEGKDFGHMVNTETGKATENGTASGSRAIGAFALGATIFKNDAYRKIAEESAETYYNRHIKTGYTNGGPHDISKAPDSESNVALLESFMDVYRLTEDKKYLTYSTQAADLFATWINAYDGVVPADSIMGKLKIQTTGGVLANTRNHHIGPSACTSSVVSLLDLYLATGDAYYLELLKEIASGIPQYVTRKLGDAGAMEPGMITEQVNITDEIAPPGSLWQLSATWPETGMFLTRLEVPSVFVDFKAGTTTVFDQLEAKTDYATKTVTVSNNTPYDASVRVMNEARKSLILEVPKSQSRKVTF